MSVEECWRVLSGRLNRDAVEDGGNGAMGGKVTTVQYDTHYETSLPAVRRGWFVPNGLKDVLDGCDVRHCSRGREEYVEGDGERCCSSIAKTIT